MNKKFKNSLKSMIIGVIGLCLVNVLSAQKVITGILKDAQTGEPLIGANVVSKENSSSGTISDFDGAYSYEVDPGTTTLVFSYAGYTSVEELINGRSVIDVNLAPGQILEDVVIIGYGTVKREDATGSVQSVSSSSFNRGAITSPQELLAGKVAGVAITTGGGPDEGAQIRVRGQSSLSASNDPLIVIDGIPVENGSVSGNRNPLNVINLNDIESMTVLKMLGYRNLWKQGVCRSYLITTKKGTLGAKLKIGYSGNYSLGTTANRVDVLKQMNTGHW
ncbi:MAG: TonB-dependent receptor plug domain-containing protein [Saprospiraceae bacterium]|nr:TonB-dependent receptor plug domain-containing protein [Saprospiraceae bacterium]